MTRDTVCCERPNILATSLRVGRRASAGERCLIVSIRGFRRPGPAHFLRNPPSRGRLAFSVRRLPDLLDPYDSDMGASLAKILKMIHDIAFDVVPCLR